MQSVRNWRHEHAPRFVQSPDEFTSAIALGQRKKVVVPFVICVGAQIWSFGAIASNHTDVHLSTSGAVDGVKGLFLRIDPANRVLADHTPVAGDIANMGDMLV